MLQLYPPQKQHGETSKAGVAVTRATQGSQDNQRRYRNQHRLSHAPQSLEDSQKNITTQRLLRTTAASPTIPGKTMK